MTGLLERERVGNSGWLFLAVMSKVHYIGWQQFMHTVHNTGYAEVLYIIHVHTERTCMHVLHVRVSHKKLFSTKCSGRLPCPASISLTGQSKRFT